MAKKYNNNKKKSSGGSDWPEAMVIIFIFALPLLVAGVPFVLFLQDNALGSFLDIWRGTVRPIIMTLNAFLIAFIIFLVLEIWPLQYRPSFFTLGKKKQKKEIIQDPAILKHWDAIEEKASVGTPDNLRLAIIEADSLVDSFLRKVGYEGDHMADRLSQISSHEVKSLDSLWDAHRLRNILVHTPGAAARPKEAKEALKAFENFLKELGAI